MSLSGVALLEHRLAELAALYGRQARVIWPRVLVRAEIDLTRYTAVEPSPEWLSEPDREKALAFVCAKLDEVRVVDGGEL